jgi:hypothetical protein
MKCGQDIDRSETGESETSWPRTSVMKRYALFIALCLLLLFARPHTVATTSFVEGAILPIDNSSGIHLGHHIERLPSVRFATCS